LKPLCIQAGIPFHPAYKNSHIIPPKLSIKEEFITRRTGISCLRCYLLISYVSSSSFLSYLLCLRFDRTDTNDLLVFPVWKEYEITFTSFSPWRPYLSLQKPSWKQRTKLKSLQRKVKNSNRLEQEGHSRTRKQTRRTLAIRRVSLDINLNSVW